MLRALLSCCLLGLALAEGYSYGSQQIACSLQQETLTVTNTHVEAVVETVTVQHYLMNHQVVDVTSVVLVPSLLTAGETSTPLEVLGMFPTTTQRFTNTVHHTTHHTFLATVVATSTTSLAATHVEVVSTVTLTQTGLVLQPDIETHTVQDFVTAVSTVTISNEAAPSAVIETAPQYITVTATSLVVVPVPATTTATTTTTTIVEATVTLTQHELVTLCYSPKITYDH